MLKNEKQIVTVIDKTPEKINSHGHEFDHAQILDATNQKALEELGVQNFDYVIVGVGNVEASITICSNLRELGVTKIMAKAKNAVHSRILGNMEVSVSVVPEIEIAENMAYRTMFDLNVEAFTFDSKVKDTFTLHVPVYNKELIDKQISDLNLKAYGACIISIKRLSNEIVVPVSGSDVIAGGDKVCLICKKHVINSVKDYFMKKMDTTTTTKK